MEHNNVWHKGTPNEQQFKEAIEALKACGRERQLPWKIIMSSAVLAVPYANWLQKIVRFQYKKKSDVEKLMKGDGSGRVNR